MQKFNRVLVLSLSVFILVLQCATLTVAEQTSKKKQSKKSTATDSKVDLNTASEKDLDALPGVGPATAKKIIAARPYSSVNDLSKSGIPASTIKKITPLVTVTGGSPSTNSNVSNTPSSPGTSERPAPSRNSSKKSTPSSTPSTSQSSQPQGNPGPGMVWVNLDSGVYHYQGSRFYGKTKNGKYMSESDATSAGYHPAKNEKKSQ